MNGRSVKACLPHFPQGVFRCFTLRYRLSPVAVPAIIICGRHVSVPVTAATGTQHVASFSVELMSNRKARALTCVIALKLRYSCHAFALTLGRGNHTSPTKNVYFDSHSPRRRRDTPHWKANNSCCHILFLSFCCAIVQKLRI